MEKKLRKTLKHYKTLLIFRILLLSLVFSISVVSRAQMSTGNKVEIEKPWPLTLKEGTRFIYDQAGKPFWLNGDAAWSLLVQPSMKESRLYIEHRAKQGFNALIVNVLEKKYSDFAPATSEGRIEPFSKKEDFSTPNEAYFKRLDELIDIAAQNGIILLLSPMYLGYLNDGDGWYEELCKNSDHSVQKYADFLASRYKNRENIIWIIGGDHNPDSALHKLNIIAHALYTQCVNPIITAHVHPGVPIRKIFNDPSWMNLSTVYDYGIIHTRIKEEYDMKPVKPFILFESTYEGEWDATPQQIRWQAWWAACGGATGVIMGNLPIWRMAKGWKNEFDSPAAKAMMVLQKILKARSWWILQPDRKKEVLLSGWGDLHTTNLAGFAYGSKGALGYFPDARNIQLKLEKKSVLTWINPENGRIIRKETRTPGVHIIKTPSGGSVDVILSMDW